MIRNYGVRELAEQVARTAATAEANDVTLDWNEPETGATD